MAEAETGAALGITDAGGRAQYGATHEAVVEALRLAQIVGASVGEAKDGDEGMPGAGPLVYRRLYYLTDHLGSACGGAAERDGG